MAPFGKSGKALSAGVILGATVDRWIARRDAPAVSAAPPPMTAAAFRPLEDDMGCHFDRSAALVPQFDEEALERAHFQVAGCAGGGAHRFLFMMPKPDKMWSCDLPPTNPQIRVETVMLHVFRRYCFLSQKGESVVNATTRRGLIFDIGANAGYFGLLGMTMGCEALFFDLQRDCQVRINNAIVVNGLSRRGRVFPFGVSSVAESFLSPGVGCDTRFPASAIEMSTFGEGEHLTRVDRLGAFVAEDQEAIMMKVDTEGNEQRVLEGAMDFFRKRLVRNAIVEVTPGHGFWDNVNVTREQVARTFREIAEFGYATVSLHDWSTRAAPQQVYEYIMGAKFGQSDIWLTLDAVNGTHVGHQPFAAFQR